jgi:predicted PurR-regulated permease PerM
MEPMMARTRGGRVVGNGGQSIEARATDFVVRLAFLGLFAYWSLELVRPFLPVVIWAVLLAVALYPAYAWLARQLGGRRGVAAAIITGLALATVLGPVSVLAANVAESAQWIASSLQAGTLQVPPPPAGIEKWPLVGDKLHEAWTLASTNLDDALRRYRPMVLPAGETVLGKVAAVGIDLLKFVVSVVIAGFLFLPGPRLATGTRQFASRLVAPRGAHFVDLAGATIRNISRGVIGVALLQTLIAGVVLEVADVPGASLLAFAILILCIVQIGPALVVVPVIIWAWTAMSLGGALALTVLLAPVLLIDNILKPILMARGLTTPMLVILTGVIGGTITHGLNGLFLGPIVLAVFYELVVAWARLESPAAPASRTTESEAAPDGYRA